MTDSKMGMFRVSEIEITYRNPVPLAQRAKISDPYSASELFREHWDKDKIELLEQFKVMMLDRGNTCLGISDDEFRGDNGLSGRYPAHFCNCFEMPGDHDPSGE